MLYAILLLILAVILFGSARVLGAASAVLGSVAALAAFGIAAVALARFLDLSTTQAIGGIAAIVFGILVAYGAVMEFRGIDPATGKKRR